MGRVMDHWGGGWGQNTPLSTGEYFPSSGRHCAVALGREWGEGEGRRYQIDSELTGNLINVVVVNAGMQLRVLLSAVATLAPSSPSNDSIHRPFFFFSLLFFSFLFFSFLFVCLVSWADFIDSMPSDWFLPSNDSTRFPAWVCAGAGRRLVSVDDANHRNG